MEQIALIDKSLIPTNELVFSMIGDKSIFWKEIMEFLYGNYKDISEEWKFYNDRKSWLFRTLKKKKTLFWIGVLKDTFRVSFWFGIKAEHIIEQSNLPETIKNDFKTAKIFNTTRCVSITVSGSKDVENIIKLINLKLSIK